MRVCTSVRSVLSIDFGTAAFRSEAAALRATDAAS